MDCEKPTVDRGAICNHYQEKLGAAPDPPMTEHDSGTLAKARRKKLRRQ